MPSWPKMGEAGGVPSMTAFSVPQHKPTCTIAFGGSVRIAHVLALALEKEELLSSQQEREKELT